LRQDYNCPLASSQKSMLRGLNISTGRLFDKVLSPSVIHSGTDEHSTNNNSHGGHLSTCSLNSGVSSGSSSPGDSLQNVSHCLGKKSNGRMDSHQRSLPNLARSSQLAVMSSKQDDPLCDMPSQHTSRRLISPVGSSVNARVVMQRLQEQKSQTTGVEGQDVEPSVASMRSGIPAPVARKGLSGIPRGGGVCKLPKAVAGSTLKTGLTQPRQNFSQPRQNDSNWREGCF